MFKIILDILASVAKYISNKQILDAGGAIKEIETIKAENEKVQEAKEIKERNAGLSRDDIIKQLQDDFRK